MAESIQRLCELRDLGRMAYGPAYELQRALVEQRKSGAIPDQLLFVEHAHVVTMGRNGKESSLLAAPDLLERAGITYFETDRGGDATYHGPGQLVGYPIFDLREWKRDVRAYVQALEAALIGCLKEFGIHSWIDPEAVGVWTEKGKIAAIGVHLSRWITSHGFALNVETDLNYFRYIVPCGLTRPVASMREFGCEATLEEVKEVMLRQLAAVFELRVVEPVFEAGRPG